MTNTEKNNDILLEARLSSIEERLEKIENTINVSNSTDKDEKQDVESIYPTEEKIKGNLFDKLLQFIDNLKIERYDNLYKAKDVIVITGYVWQGQKQLNETLPKKEIRYIKTKRSYFISKSAVLRLLFLSKNKKINGFINSFCRSVIQEACND